ncbi:MULTISPECIES: ATP-binding protein [unclassified Streptomyces]|uniref:ATP-binding protein n=1 Tax=unclassified Streptomyces TaxID=2593676 RepID=UPI002E345633|nr:ATP-binding protein [Streptomyces sp. NBC_01428]
MYRSPEETGGAWARPSVMEASLALDGDGARIAQGRHLAAVFLAGVRDMRGVPVVTATVEIVQLIVSELVTNARKYAPGPALLNLRIADSVLQVELCDTNPSVPSAEEPDPARIGRHGLEIVSALAQSVTVEATSTGKSITAVVSLGEI